MKNFINEFRRLFIIFLFISLIANIPISSLADSFLAPSSIVNILNRAFEKKLFETMKVIRIVKYNVFEMEQLSTGKRYFLKIMQRKNIRTELLIYSLAKRLGCNVPSMTRVEPSQYKEIKEIKMTEHPENKLETSLGMLTADVFQMGSENLSHEEGTGLEEALVFLQFSLCDDIEFGIKNSVIRKINEINHLILYDFLGPTQAWITKHRKESPPNIEVMASGNFSRFWINEIKELDPKRVVRAVQQVFSITAEEITCMALDSGYTPADIDIEKFLNRRKVFFNEIVSGLESIKDQQSQAKIILEALNAIKSILEVPAASPCLIDETNKITEVAS